MHGWVFVWAYHGYHNNLYKHLSLSDQQHDKHKRNEGREATCLWKERGEEQWNTTTTGIGE